MQSSDDYRSLYCRLLDDPDFQALSPEAQRLFFFLRLSSECGPTGLFRWYSPVTCSRMGVAEAELKAPLAELQRGRWIGVEAGYILIRNALRFEPTFKPATNSKHLVAVHRHLGPLGHLAIARELLDDLGLDYPPEWESEAQAGDPGKARCHKAVTRALKSGRLSRGPCVACGVPEVVAHHEDYEKPLEVLWLCELHYQERHRQLDAGIPYPATWDTPSYKTGAPAGEGRDTLSRTSGSTAPAPAPAPAPATATVAVDGAGATTAEADDEIPSPEFPPDDDAPPEVPDAEANAYPWHPDDERDFGDPEKPHGRWRDYVEVHMAKKTPPPWPRFFAWLKDDVKRRGAPAKANPVQAGKPRESAGEEAGHEPQTRMP